MPKEQLKARPGKAVKDVDRSKARKAHLDSQKKAILGWFVSAEKRVASIKSESQMTSIEKMDVTRKGISKNALEQLKDKSGFDYDQLSWILGVARTTLLNKKGTDKFPPSLSEKIMSLADLYSFGYEIFGSPEEFNQWIFQSLPALGGKAPYAFLDNQYGREEIRNLIGRIAYGVYS